MSEHSEPHVVPLSVYTAVLVALMIGTVITVWVAFIDLGPFNTPIALVIAFAKAALVVLYFMHVRYGTALTWIMVSGGILWLMILIVFTVIDFRYRGWL